jgi:hypothetical protein
MMSTHMANMSLHTDGLVFEVGRSGLSQNSSAFKTERLPQHKTIVTDGPPSHRDHLIPLWET